MGGKIDPITEIYQKMNSYWRSNEDAKRNGITYGKIQEICAGLDIEQKASSVPFLL